MLTFAEAPSDNLTGAGITAAMMANVVLVAFVVTALREDSGEEQSTAEAKKTR